MTGVADREEAPPVPVGRAVAVGVIAGLASGLFGVGGGIVIVPGLVLLAGLQQRLAHGTSLTAIVPIAIVGTIGYATAGEVDFAVAGAMAAGAVVGAPVGVSLLNRLPQRALRLGFSLVLVLTAIRMVVDVPAGEGRAAIDLADALWYALTGFAAGVLSGVMGVGGGVLVVPILALLFASPLVLAKGTSLAVIVPTALVGTWRNVRRGSTDVRAGLIVGAGGVLTAAVASQISLEMDPVVSAWTFAALLVATALRMARATRRTPR